jgi:hypothetical protein
MSRPNGEVQHLDNPAAHARALARHERRLAWARDHLPKQDANAVAGALSALFMISHSRRKPTLAAVEERMRVSGTWQE